MLNSVLPLFFFFLNEGDLFAMCLLAIYAYNLVCLSEAVCQHGAACERGREHKQGETVINKVEMSWF